MIPFIGPRQGIEIRSQFHATSIEWSNEMKRLAIIRGGAAIALMLGIVVAVASSADASPSGQVGAYMRQGLSLKRAQVALATQAQVETAELPLKLEKALGASFAGMWFEPGTGKFRIGVVSSASRRAAERVVAQADLAGVVSYVSVRSTWTQLIDAQGEWNIKLEHLGGRQFSTDLTASRNAVSVTLSSAVSEHERLLLEREAAGSGVNVSITVVPPEALVLETRNSQCEFKRAEAYCSKPITAGVLITPENTSKPTKYCTAGPLAILLSPATLAAGLETFLITAGHCLQEAEKWFSSTHPGKETKEVGPRVQFKNGLPGDYGDILVSPNWLEAGVTPALAQITHYQDNGLREARSVIGEEASVEKASFCKQGATSAEQCGIITGLNKLGVFSGVHVEGLVKTNACGEGGDSGGPYATLPTGNSVRILGTEVGGPKETCSGLFCTTTCESSYEPIKTSLEGLGLTLLTTTNQTRHK
jgi:streptogrisin C